nr:hypothetical protein [Tanacetum cinerariifolium]
WGLRKSTLNHLMCMSYTDVAQVANAARRGVVIGISRPLSRVVTGATVIITTVIDLTGEVVVTTTAAATTTTLAVTTGRGVVIGTSRPLSRVVTGATVIVTTVMDLTGAVAMTTTAAAITTTTLAVTTGIPVMDVTKETGVISPTDLPILVLSNPGVPLRVSPIQFSLLMDVDTKESVVELQADKKPGASGRVFAITEEMIEVTNAKVVVAKEKLKESRTRQKSYADKHRRSLEFQLGDHVFLKVSPVRGVRHFGIKGKLGPRFIGPFEILDRVGYKYHPLHLITYPLDQIRIDLSYEEEPEAILDRQDRIMRKKTIPFVKILLRNHPEREATWETEESIQTSYPHFLP